MGKRSVIILTLFLLAIMPLTAAYEFCTENASGEGLEIMEIIDSSQIDETNWSWSPGDQITIDARVLSNLSTRDFELELFFLNEDLSSKNITRTSTNPVKTISLTQNETIDTNFSFQLSSPNPGIYYLYAKLVDASNDSICTSLKAVSSSSEADISITPEEKILTVRKVTGPLTITKGQEVKYTLEVINLGNLAEEKILAIAYNANLGIRETKEMASLGAGESRNVTINFTVNQSVPSQEEDFLFTVEYDYREDTDYYYQSAEKAVRFKVSIVSDSNETTIEPIEILDANQTIANKTTQSPANTSQGSTATSQGDEDGEDLPSILWVVIPVLVVILVLVGAFFWLKQRNEAPANPKISKPVSEYLQKIKIKSVMPSSPSTPVEMSTANTNTPQTSQNPPRAAARSLSRPAATSSSPESNPSKPVELHPVSQQKPQTNQPSPQPQDQDKTSSQ